MRSLPRFISRITRFFHRNGRVVEGYSGQLLSETTAGQLGQAIMENKCPDCGSNKGFYEGPSGGMSTNMFCAACGQGFNFTNILGEGHAERIHKLKNIK